LRKAKEPAIPFPNGRLPSFLGNVFTVCCNADLLECVEEAVKNMMILGLRILRYGINPKRLPVNTGRFMKRQANDDGFGTILALPE